MGCAHVAQCIYMQAFLTLRKYDTKYNYILHTWCISYLLHCGAKSSQERLYGEADPIDRWAQKRGHIRNQGQWRCGRYEGTFRLFPRRWCLHHFHSSHPFSPENVSIPRLQATTTTRQSGVASENWHTPGSVTHKLQSLLTLAFRIATRRGQKHLSNHPTQYIPHYSTPKKQERMCGLFDQAPEDSTIYCKLSVHRRLCASISPP